MKVIHPSFEILNNTDNILKDIESVARTCYKSEAKITNDSYESFCRNLFKRKHLAMFEFGENIIFRITWLRYLRTLLKNPKYLNLTFVRGRALVSGSLRAFYEFSKEYPKQSDYINTIVQIYYNLDVVITDVEPHINKHLIKLQSEDVYKNYSEKEILTHLTLTVRFICDRGVSHEIVRHRPVSYAQESTRYCNYGNDKGITVIQPFWIDDAHIDNLLHLNEHTIRMVTSSELKWYDSMVISQNAYLGLLNSDWSLQEARSVLPNALKTEIVVKTTLKEWQHVFTLRTASAAHPQMREIMYPLLKEAKSLLPGTFDHIIVSEHINNACKQ